MSHLEKTTPLTTMLLLKESKKELLQQCYSNRVKYTDHKREVSLTSCPPSGNNNREKQMPWGRQQEINNLQATSHSRRLAGAASGHPCSSTSQQTIQTTMDIQFGIKKGKTCHAPTEVQTGCSSASPFLRPASAPIGGYTAEYVTHSWCDASHTATFLTAKHCNSRLPIDWFSFPIQYWLVTCPQTAAHLNSNLNFISFHIPSKSYQKQFH